jgi:hypothetical protein
MRKRAKERKYVEGDEIKRAEPELEPEPVGTVFIWGLRNRNRIQNTVPVPWKEMKPKAQKNLLKS